MPVSYGRTRYANGSRALLLDALLFYNAVHIIADGFFFFFFLFPPFKIKFNKQTRAFREPISGFFFFSTRVTNPQNCCAPRSNIYIILSGRPGQLVIAELFRDFYFRNRIFFFFFFLPEENLSNFQFIL